MLIQSKITGLGNQSISDAQYVDVVSSYAGVFSKIDANNFKVLNILVLNMTAEDMLFFGHDNAIASYSHFNGDLISEVDSDSVKLMDSVSFKYYSSDLFDYSSFSKLNLESELLDCPVSVMKNPRCSRVTGCRFETDYCDFLEVLS